MLGICGYALLKSTFKSNKLTDNIRKKEKKVTIVRGVPGVGKDTYVLTKEEGKKDNFTVVCSDDFFVKDGKYEFNRKELSQAEAYCLEQYQLHLSLGVPRIYITNVNNKKWMYSNYIRLASLWI